MMSKARLEHLDPVEQCALAEFVQHLRNRFDGGLYSTLLFGSRARGEGAAGSDLDILVVVESNDWRIHKEIRYLAADICYKYDLDLSPRVWSVEHLREMEQLGSHLVQSIQQDSISLSEL